MEKDKKNSPKKTAELFDKLTKAFVATKPKKKKAAKK